MAHASISPSVVPVRSMPGMRIQMKICENGCGRRFARPIPIFARMGQKFCDACLAEMRK